MKIFNTNFRGLKIIKGITHYDKRGYFRETFKNSFFKDKNFIFWLISKSKKNVIRGLHFQDKKPQGKFISVIKGKIIDVVVDLRKNSKTYGKHFKIILSERNCTSVYIPAGFAHGFGGLEKENIVIYSCTSYRYKKGERGILWNDKVLRINWGIKKPILSLKDKKNINFKDYK